MSADTTNSSDGSTAEDSDTFTPVENRSEIVFLIDAQDANPNGDPLSPSNKPRQDPATGQGIITDVRLKRYLRDQIATECGEDQGVYIADVRTEAGNRKTRSELAEAIADVDGPEDIGEGFLDDFLDTAVDVRYFGATFSFSIDESDESQAIAEQIDNHLPAHLTGPVQISPGRTFHRVRENSGYNSLTSVISTNQNDGDGESENDNDDRGNVQGGFQLDDHRIVYGLYGFSAVVNEHNADNTRLRQSDVEWLDKLFWKGVKNQANSRSKRGQHPRLYLRVEYDEGFHVGTLDRTLDLGDHSKGADELTSVEDVTVDVTEMMETLESVSDRIQTVHILQDTRLTIEQHDDVVDQTLPDLIESDLDVEVNRISLYE
ncbi:type I-B CRISPR-associated protein Cas7/Csh2 (plasmid) [Halorubrum sp. BOL3-1]|uniref:type I-B CRISPR-associated protein Cas7/Csh2 n=1 Tax=Halorubrum sp. BOL3-1 TaxID=2497325 RepID=UPI001004DDAB|nr:type I-B CRISPR-associated protein Cas7/Csh2 [Halorubrum sp. BOL3-1]QAU14457.1 type I-B CRISPR-associated protein Cas7/Csh2 [Halorubrum sp. BOL3-1]